MVRLPDFPQIGFRLPDPAHAVKLPRRGDTAQSGAITVAAASNQGTVASSAITRHPWVIPVAPRHKSPVRVRHCVRASARSLEFPRDFAGVRSNEIWKVAGSRTIDQRNRDLRPAET